MESISNLRFFATFVINELLLFRGFGIMHILDIEIVKPKKQIVHYPEGKQIFEGEIADYYFEDNGILVSLSKNPKRTVENISRNVELVKKITGAKQSPY